MTTVAWLNHGCPQMEHSPSIILLELALLVLEDVVLLILQLVPLPLQLRVHALQLAVLHAQTIYLLVQGEAHALQL